MIKNRKSLELIGIYTILVIAIIFISLFFIKIDKSIIIGFLIGYIFTVLKLFLIERIIMNSLKKHPSKAESYVKIHYLIRFLLTFVILLISFADSSINGYVVAFLFILLKPATYIYGIFIKGLDSKYEIVEFEDDDYDEYGDFWQEVGIGF